MAFPLLQANIQRWSKGEEAKLKQLAKHNGLGVLSLVLGRPETTVRQKAVELGVQIRQ